MAEQLNTNAGLGFMINQATQFLQNDVIFVALLVYTILGLLTDWLVRMLERRALAWRRGLLAAVPSTGAQREPHAAAAGRRSSSVSGPDAAPSATAASSTSLDLEIAPRRVRRPDRPQRLGQVDAAAGARRPGPRADRRAGVTAPWRGVPGRAPGALEARAGQRRASACAATTRAAVAAAALAEVGLEDHHDAWPLTLSGGEAQRVSLARALVREPELLLLDEPFGALDALTRIAMHELVLGLWERHRPAILLVTHDVDEALALADRVLVLADGRIAHQAPVALDRPRERDHPELIALRNRLLAELGVDTKGTHENDRTATRTRSAAPLAVLPRAARRGRLRRRLGLGLGGAHRGLQRRPAASAARARRQGRVDSTAPPAARRCGSATRPGPAPRRC